MFETVTVAALSIRPLKGDKIANADKLEHYFRAAVRQGEPAVVVAPEGFLEGYLVVEVIARQRTPDELLEIAEPIDGPYIRRFRALARELKTNLCLSFAERIDDSSYNAAIFIDVDGEICGKYHKTQFAEGTHERWDFNRIGDSLRAFDTPVGRAGFLICNDRGNPDIARAIVMDGARLLLIPTYGSRNRGQNLRVLARARENGVPVVQANVGMNLIVSKGEIVAYAWGHDRITIADIDIPLPPDTKRARAMETQYLAERPPRMTERYRNFLGKRGIDPW